jgi:hypothetical protein
MKEKKKQTKETYFTTSHKQLTAKRQKKKFAITTSSTNKNRNHNHNQHTN